MMVWLPRGCSNFACRGTLCACGCTLCLAILNRSTPGWWRFRIFRITIINPLEESIHPKIPFLITFGTKNMSEVAARVLLLRFQDEESVTELVVQVITVCYTRW